MPCDSRYAPAYGALLYTILNGKRYVILGKENGMWSLFRGHRAEGETPEQASIREVYEETCGTVQMHRIKLDYNFSVSKKVGRKGRKWNIGLYYVTPKVIDEFYANRSAMYKKMHKEIRESPSKEIAKEVKDKMEKFFEKSDLAMFDIDDSRITHHKTRHVIDFFVERGQLRY